MKAKEVALIGLMLALALMLQVSPFKIKTPWGMDIDFVAVPIMIIYFIYSFRESFLGLALLFLGLTLIAQSSWLGASMKFFATLSVLLGLEIAKRLTGFSTSSLNSAKTPIFIVLALTFAVLIRAPLMIAMNYYYAIPIWFGIPREQVIPVVEEFTHMPFWLAISLPNAIQTVVDVIGGFLVSFPVIRALPHVVKE
ncbi:hypothetical protein PAP_09675 [Palaeococcus pacificus DY20341]|uniref:Riboflavin transporter n=1 Tax=Palaeococcus pacificus DY20341 TaxID=1343739 RepID=A0A075LUB7_9EURY|nr:membrane protein [Palaeococcus pacificus]AIF70310.1 hypothetical protein PAP_09675 [Palaeococcus pacificus DY20341]